MDMKLSQNQSEVVKQFPSFRSSGPGEREETFGGNYLGFIGRRIQQSADPNNWGAI